MKFYSYLKQLRKFNGFLVTLNVMQHWKDYKEWKVQLNSKKMPIDLELPWLTISAKNYMDQFFDKLKTKDSRVFEYGTGGSSLYFSNKVSKVVGVEHDKEWFEKVVSTFKSKKQCNWEGHLCLPVKTEMELDFENPIDYGSSAQEFIGFDFSNYCKKIREFDDEYFDAVLVDGRARPSCIVESVNKIKKGGILIIDNSERDYYYTNTGPFLKDFKLVVDSYSALICYPLLTKTNIFIKNAS